MAKTKSVLGKRKRNSEASKQSGTLMSSKSGGTTTLVTRTPVVPRSYMTKMNNNEVVCIRNTEVLFNSWPISTGTWGIIGRYNTLAANFVWAANIGLNFSQYRFKKLRLHYKPIVSTSTTGYFAMAFVSDPEDVTSVDTFTVGNTLSRMSNCRRFVQVPVWQEATMEILPGDFSQDWYIYDPATITDQSTARQAAAGGLFITAQAPDTAATGIIYAEYEIELRNPVSSLANR